MKFHRIEDVGLRRSGLTAPYPTLSLVKAVRSPNHPLASIDSNLGLIRSGTQIDGDIAGHLHMMLDSRKFCKRRKQLLPAISAGTRKGGVILCK